MRGILTYSSHLPGLWVKRSVCKLHSFRVEWYFKFYDLCLSLLKNINGGVNIVWDFPLRFWIEIHISELCSFLLLCGLCILSPEDNNEGLASFYSPPIIPLRGKVRTVLPPPLSTVCLFQQGKKRHFGIFRISVEVSSEVSCLTKSRPQKQSIFGSDPTNNWTINYAYSKITDWWIMVLNRFRVSQCAWIIYNLVA